MKDNRGKSKPPKEEIDRFYTFDKFLNMKTAATKDYTGLEPNPPLSEEEMEASSGLYDLPGADDTSDVQDDNPPQSDEQIY